MPTYTHITPTDNQLQIEPVFQKTPIEVENPDGTKSIKEMDQPQDIFKIINHGKNVPETEHTHILAKVVAVDVCKVYDTMYFFIEQENVLAYLTENQTEPSPYAQPTTNE
jgi:hypothetical protein